MTRTYVGSCHCGNLSVRLESEKTPAELGWRMDDCSFCERHQARYTSDPAGAAHIVVRDGRQISRYRFATRTADFLVCRTCGALIGALSPDDHPARLVVNVHCLDDRAEFHVLPIQMGSLDGESAEQRRARRAARWTPVASFVEDALASAGQSLPR